MGIFTNIALYLGILFAFIAIISLFLWRMWLTGDRSRFIVPNELISGETMSRRAKRVMFPLFLIAFFDFISSCIRWGVTGFSGFTNVTPEGAGYSVVEHGHRFHLTPSQLLLGRIQVFSFIVCVVAYLFVRAYFLHSGDIKRDKPSA